LVTVEAIDGDVEVNGAATLVRVRTGAGTVRLTGVRGDVSAATVGGAVLLHTEEIVNARLETISGPVDVGGRLPPNGVLDVQTHDGDATVALERPLDGQFDLTSVEGKIVTHLFDQPDKVYQEHTARFAVGPSAGLARGFRVTVRSFKGTIWVRSNPRPVGGV